MSVLQSIADQLRDLAQQTGPIYSDVEAAAGQLRQIAHRVASLKRSGVDTRSLEGAILNAEVHAEQAADAVRQIQSDGVDWANQLARGGSETNGPTAQEPRAQASIVADHLTSSRSIESSGSHRFGLQDVDVKSIDTSDNPILGKFGRGSTERADYEWAVQTWHQVVKPTLDGGADRAYFEQLDDHNEAGPLRRTADVYDLFLGSTDRIMLSRRPDGSLEVVNGRHRIEIARQLGVTSLPAEVFERRTTEAND